MTGAYPIYTTTAASGIFYANVTTTNWPATVNAPALRTMPQGPPLRIPPLVGLWVSERSIGAKPRKIIEVSCGNYIVCEGKRHSKIEWANLRRYVEVSPPYDHTWNP